MEEFKTMPFGSVWDELCVRGGVPVGADWLGDMEAYEKQVLQARA